MRCDVGYTSDFLEERIVFESFLYAFETRLNFFNLIFFFGGSENKEGPVEEETHG